MGIDAIPDDLLELILLLISSSVLLVRAASTCKQWRRIIAKSDFLRRFRHLHRPPVAGYYYDNKRFCPSPPSAAAVDGRHFSLDFLPVSYLYNPRACNWRILDSRGSLLLLEHFNYMDGCREMVVCEPITRRFQKIPPSSIVYAHRDDKVFLLNGGSNVRRDGIGISMSSFRVLCLADEGDPIHAGVFTSGEDSWKETTTGSTSMTVIGVATGSIYWYTGGRKLVTLDQSSAEFSSFKLPSGTEDWDGLVSQHRLAVTAGHDGRVRVAVGVAGGDMKVYARLPAGGGSRDEWMLETRIPLLMAIRSLLPWRECWYFNRLPVSYHRTGAVVVIATGVVSLSPGPATPLMVRLDIETMAVERMPDPNMGTAYPCELPWPPVFRACTDDGVRAT